MRTYLSALGWIDARPEGNRLRWHLPAGHVAADGRVIGFPQRMRVQRARIDADLVTFPGNGSTPRNSLAFPSAFWSAPVDIDGPAFPAPLRVDLGSGKQAIAFTFAGTDVADLRVRDADGALLRQRRIHPGDEVYLEFSDAAELRVMGRQARLRGFRMLDAFKDPGLGWDTVADIDVDGGLSASLDQAASRLPGGAGFEPDQWQDLRDIVDEARTWTPLPAHPPMDAPPHAAIALLTSLRWSHAVMAGLGFCDGPGAGAGPLDRLANVLRQAPDHHLLYRVQPWSPDRQDPPSNIVPVARGIAPLLATPSPPEFVSAVARLRPDGASTPAALRPRRDGFAPLPRRFPYAVRAMLRWGMSDPHAIGVEIQEDHDASAVAGAPASTTRYLCRSLTPSDTRASAMQPRDLEVAFPDTRLRARARAFDAWDRVSPFSAPGPWTPLELDHAPPGPQIDQARRDGAETRLTLAPWTPDPIVLATRGMVEILRQTGTPRTISIPVMSIAPVPLDAGMVQATFATPLAAPEDFTKGSFSAGTVTLPIGSVTATYLRFALPDSRAGDVPDPGSFTLRQSPHHRTAWTMVHAVPAPDATGVVVFVDPLPIAPQATAVTYATRLRYWGARRGPIGGLQQALLAQVPLDPPPTFAVTLLSLDVFGRMLVRVRLSAPDPIHRYRVFAADGVFDTADPAQDLALAEQARPGLSPARVPQGGTDLFDILTLPVSKYPVDVTIALQRVGEAGGESGYTVRSLQVPAPTGEGWAQG